MDCSVTTRWTKRSNRFLKPTFDESEFPPHLYWYLKWSGSQHSVDSDAALWGMELDSGRRRWGGLRRFSRNHPSSFAGQRRTFFRSRGSRQSAGRFSDQAYCNPGWRIRRYANRGVSRRKITYGLFYQSHSDQRNECPSIYSNARGSGRKQLGTQSHQYAVAEQPAPY